jgi:hypothetical protein
MHPTDPDVLETSAYLQHIRSRESSCHNRRRRTYIDALRNLLIAGFLLFLAFAVHALIPG